MASPARQTLDPVALQNAIRLSPDRWQFFAAARWLECAHPQHPRVGESVKASEDFIRFCHSPSLSFSPRMIDRLEPGTASAPPRLHGFFLGLFGPNGPLPIHLTEYAIQRARHERDRTFIAFADTFHHRMLGLFYRAWAAAEPTVQADRPGHDDFRTYTGSFVGLASGRLENRDRLSDDYKRFYAGRLLAQPRGAEGLLRFLEGAFHVPMSIIEFVAEWMRLPADAHLRLEAHGEMTRLGQTAVIGESVYGAQQRFRLRIGPLTKKEFARFLPGGESLKQLLAAVRFYVGDEKAWDIQLVIRKDMVPATKLGKSGQLGLTSWMSPPQPALDHPDDVVLRPVG